MYFIEDFKNRFDFFLRNNIRFSLKNYKENPYNIEDINLSDKQKELYLNLKNKYNLIIFDCLNKRNFLENLYFLNIFDRYFSKKTNKDISILDIGSKNFSYVRSQYLFFTSFSSVKNLNGIELDAYRLCSNLYNRYEIAKFYKKDLLNTNFIAGDLLNHNQRYDYIIWILPFITRYPQIKWGLPLKYFKPEKMLIHAYNLLNKDGEMLIINQGEKEAIIQNDLIKKANLKVSLSFEKIEDEFELFKNERYCFKLIKS